MPAFTPLSIPGPDHENHQRANEALTAAFNASGGGPRSGSVAVFEDDTPAQVAAKLAGTYPEYEPLYPDGMGRRIKMPAARVWADVNTAISTMNGIEGAGIGSTVIKVRTKDLAPGQYSAFPVLDDPRSEDGIRAQGRIDNTTFHGNLQDIAGANLTTVLVDGYVLTDRAEGPAHVMNNTEFHNFSGNGVVVGWGGDQFCSDRLRVENCEKIALIIGNSAGAASDGKHTKMGLTSRGGALLVEKSSFTVDQFDMWIPTNFNGKATVELRDANRCTFRTGTIEGRLYINGKNDQGTGVRGEHTHHLVENTSIKYAAEVKGSPFYTGGSPPMTYDSYVLIEDADGVHLSKVTFGFEESELVANLPAYYIKHSSLSGDTTRLGRVFVDGAHNWLSRFKATGVVPRVGFKTHYSSHPELVHWEGFNPGRPELVHVNMLNGAGPDARHYGKYDGTTVYTKADFPFGYLWATLWNTTRGTLDDAQVNFILPALASPYTDWVYAMRLEP
jgi:hypothetical protein